MPPSGRVTTAGITTRADARADEIVPAVVFAAGAVVFAAGAVVRADALVTLVDLWLEPPQPAASTNAIAVTPSIGR